MTISALINGALKEIGDSPENRLAIEVVLAYTLKMNKEQLFRSVLKKISEEDITAFMVLFERFKAGEPVAYLTGVKEFYGLEFIVNQNVLIPRPETEHLVDEVLEFVKIEQVKNLRILDVGTGSGCIAVSLAKHIPDAEITAVDVSGEALEVAKLNAEKHSVSNRIKISQSDLLENVHESFDIVVANLPYIGEKKFNFVSKEALEYEPHVALFGGENGLSLYEKLFEQMDKKSWKPRLLLGEFGFLQGEEVRALLNKYFVQQSVRIVKDYASIERVFVVGFDMMR
jgi:release factor glutamine methyltransferase